MNIDIESRIVIAESLQECFPCSSELEINEAILHAEKTIKHAEIRKKIKEINLAT